MCGNIYLLFIFLFFLFKDVLRIFLLTVTLVFKIFFMIRKTKSTDCD